jgi:hypothetical protein
MLTDKEAEEIRRGLAAGGGSSSNAVQRRRLAVTPPEQRDQAGPQQEQRRGLRLGVRRRGHPRDQVVALDC